MNIFALDPNPKTAAKFHCDKHVIKMSTEYCQILCTSLHLFIESQMKSTKRAKEHVKECDNCRIKFMEQGVDLDYNYERLNLQRSIIPYKKTHQNHPSVKWASESINNFLWLYYLALNTHKQYTLRYGKIHASSKVINFIDQNREIILYGASEDDLKDPGGNITSPIPLVMPDAFKTDSIIESYRNYYRYDKIRFAKWEKGVLIPNWMLSNMN